MLIIDNFIYGNAIYSLRSRTKSLHIVITDIPGQCKMKNIRYWGNQALPGGLKRGRNGGKMLIIDSFTTAMPYIRCKLNKSLQIYLDSVKWKIFVSGVTKHFQGLKKGAKWGQNAIIDNFTTVMPYIRCKSNKIVTYRNYRYTRTVWNEKHSLLG